MKTQCPSCHTELEIENPDGSSIACPVCSHEFQPAVKAVVAKARSGGGALNGSVLCLVVGLALLIYGRIWFFVYLPLFLAAFVLAIVAIAQRRVFVGVCALLLSVFLPVFTAFAIAYLPKTREWDGQTAIIAAPEQSTGAEVKPVEIVEWSVTFNKRRSTGSVLADWKFHLRNNSESRKIGQLFLLGYDKDGFECYQNIFEVLTTIPAGGEVKKIHEAFFNVGVYDKIDKFGIVWK